MILKQLVIRRKSYWDTTPIENNPFIAEVTFQTEIQAELKMPLSEEITRRILDVVADELVKGAREVAFGLTAEIVQAKGQLLTQETSQS